MKPIFILTFFLFSQMTLSSNTGANLAFNKTLVSNFGSSLLPILNNLIATTKIPDYNTHYGPVKLKAYNFKMDFKLKEDFFSYLLDEPHKIVVNIHDAAGTVNLLAKTSLGIIHKTCKVKVTFKINGKIQANVSRQQETESTVFIPLIDIKDVNLTYGINVTITGGIIGKIVNQFKGDIAKVIRKEVEKQVEKLRQKSNNTINKLIQKYLPNVEIYEGTSAKISIVEEPHLVDGKAFSLNSLISFNSAQNNSDEEVNDYLHKQSFLSYFQETKLPEYDPESNEMQGFLGLKIIREFLEEYFSENSFSFTIKMNELENKHPRLMVENHVKRLNSLFSLNGESDILVKVEFTKAPEFQLTDQTIAGTSEFIVYIILDKGKKRETLATFTVMLRFKANGELIKGVGHAQVDEIFVEKVETKLSTEEDPDLLKEFLNEFFADLIQQFNEAYSQHLELKEIVTEKVIIRDPTVKIREGYLHVGISPELDLE